MEKLIGNLLVSTGDGSDTIDGRIERVGWWLIREATDPGMHRWSIISRGSLTAPPELSSDELAGNTWREAVKQARAILGDDHADERDAPYPITKEPSM